MTMIFRPFACLALVLVSLNALALGEPANHTRGLLSFIEPNQGQTLEAYSHVARVPAYTAYLSADQAVFVMSVPANAQADSDAPAAFTSASMQMQLIGASEPVGVTEADALKGHSNYLRGNDPAGWITGVPHFGKLRFSEVYPGVDLVYTLQNNAVRYDFIVAPGANAQVIQLGFAGASTVKVAPTGELRVQSETAELVHSAPFIYQEIDGETLAIDGGFVAQEDGSLRFALASHDAGSELVIDPQIAFSTLLGGSASDAGQALAVDSAGRIVVVGSTTSLDFPLADSVPPGLTGGLDIFVARLAADGQSLEFATYIGGSDSENPHQVKLDAAGNMVIAGYTSSSDYPVVNAAQPTFQGGGIFNSDAFVTKLSAAGDSLVYSTFLGGSEPIEPFSGYEWIRSITLDADGRVYVAGETSSADFPATQALDGRGCMEGEAGVISSLVGDAFVARLSAAGALEFAVCIGGAERDNGRGIALGNDGTIHLVGFTRSDDYPVTPGAFQTINMGYYDTHVTRLAADGSAILSSTFVGGDYYEYAQQVRVAADGSSVVVGSTASVDFPTTPGSVQPRSDGALYDEDAYVYRLSADASQLLFSTYLGGYGSDTGWGLELDVTGRIYLAGYTTSPDFPLKNATQTLLAGAASFGEDVGPAADDTRALARGTLLINGELVEVLAAANNGDNRLYQLDQGGLSVATYDITSDFDDTSDIVMADMNFDGVVDVVVAANHGAPSKVYIPDGTGGFLLAGDLSGGILSTEAMVVDFFPGSAEPDLVVGNYNEANLYYPGQGVPGRGGLSTGFGPGIAAFPGSELTTTLALATGDVNGDGFLDVLEGNDGQVNRIYLGMAGGAFAAGTAVSVETDATTAVVLADIDGDFLLDVLVGNNGAPNRLHRNLGGGVFGPAEDLDPAAGTTTSLVAIDAESDGDIDLLSGDAGTGWAYINNGTGQFYRLPQSLLAEPTKALVATTFPAVIYSATAAGTSIRRLNIGMEDGFVAAMDISGTKLLFSTYLGGTGRENLNWGMAADNTGNVYITGDTAASDFPTVAALQPALSGDSDAFIVKLDLEINGSSPGATYVTTLNLQEPSIDGIDRIEFNWSSGACGSTALTDYSMSLYAGAQLLYTDAIMVNGELQPVGTEPRDFPTWDFDYATLELRQFNTGADAVISNPGATGIRYLASDNLSLPDDGEVFLFKYDTGMFVGGGSVLLASQSTSILAADCDGDGVDASIDNCTLQANADQSDTDGDGFGNLCDADLTNDCNVNFLDLGAMKAVFFSADPDADLNGDGAVNFQDLGLMKQLFFAAPGPSGVPNICQMR